MYRNVYLFVVIAFLSSHLSKVKMKCNLFLRQKVHQEVLAEGVVMAGVVVEVGVVAEVGVVFNARDRVEDLWGSLTYNGRSSMGWRRISAKMFHLLKFQGHQGPLCWQIVLVTTWTVCFRHLGSVLGN